jgi:hypothetical protein
MEAKAQICILEHSPVAGRLARPFVDRASAQHTAGLGFERHRLAASQPAKIRKERKTSAFILRAQFHVMVEFFKNFFFTLAVVHDHVLQKDERIQIHTGELDGDLALLQANHLTGYANGDLGGGPGQLDLDSHLLSKGTGVGTRYQHPPKTQIVQITPDYFAIATQLGLTSKQNPCEIPPFTHVSQLPVCPYRLVGDAESKRY